MLAVFKGYISSQRCIRCSAVRVLTPLVAVLLLVSSVSAQRYKSIDPKLKGRAARSLKSDAANSMRNAATYQAGGKEKVDQYFKTVFFPEMTLTSEAALAELGDSQSDLIKVLRGSTVPAAQQQLTQLSLGVMRAIARDNYHPAVRYNAALILGMLDQEYPGAGAQPTPPVVLPAATNELLELLEQQEFNGVKVHPSVKVGALEGLDRHVRFGLDAQYAERVTKAAMAALSQEAADLEIDADVNNWMKCQAATILAWQFAESPNAEVHTTLTKLIDDDEMSLTDRCYVMGLLEKIKFGGAAGLDLTSTLAPLGKLTKAVVAEGAEKAQEYQDLRLGKGSRRFGSTYGSRGVQEPKLERRQLLSRLTSIELGASSLGEGLPPEQKQQVQELTNALQPVMKISTDSRALDLDVMSEVLKLEDSVNNVLASWQGAAPADDSAEEEFLE